MGLMASSMLSLTACTDLTENLYSTLNDTNIDFDSEKDVASLMGQAIAQYRYMHCSWFGSCYSKDNKGVILMLLNLIQSIIDGFATVLLTIVTVLPSSPFEGLYNLSMDEQFLGYLSWLLPIAEMLALLQAWGENLMNHWVVLHYVLPD